MRRGCPASNADVSREREKALLGVDISHYCNTGLQSDLEYNSKVSLVIRDSFVNVGQRKSRLGNNFAA